jgi:hypothetical protein
MLTPNLFTTYGIDQKLKPVSFNRDYTDFSENLFEMRIPANSATDSEVKSATDSRACWPAWPGICIETRYCVISPSQKVQIAGSSVWFPAPQTEERCAFKYEAVFICRSAEPYVEQSFNGILNEDKLKICPALVRNVQEALAY